MTCLQILCINFENCGTFTPVFMNIFKVEANPVQMVCQCFYSAVMANSKLDYFVLRARLRGHFGRVIYKQAPSANECCQPINFDLKRRENTESRGPSNSWWWRHECQAVGTRLPKIKPKDGLSSILTRGKEKQKENKDGSLKKGHQNALKI